MRYLFILFATIFGLLVAAALFLYFTGREMEMLIVLGVCVPFAALTLTSIDTAIPSIRTKERSSSMTLDPTESPMDLFTVSPLADSDPQRAFYSSIHRASVSQLSPVQENFQTEYHDTRQAYEDNTESTYQEALRSGEAALSRTFNELTGKRDKPEI